MDRGAREEIVKGKGGERRGKWGTTQLQRAGSMSFGPTMGKGPVEDLSVACTQRSQKSTDQVATASERCVWLGGVRTGRLRGTQDKPGNHTPSVSFLA